MHALIRNVRLALVLTLSNDKQFFPSFIESDYLISTTGILNSFLPTNVQSGQNSITARQDQELDQKFINKLSIKYLTIIDKNLSSVDIAIDRLLKAVCSRDNYDDALIDAVMCWENIIGSNSEVSFRTCASISKLLAKNDEQRHELYEQLKSIYSQRSSLVHGNANYKTKPEIVQKAIFYAIQLLNVVLEDDRLLSMKSDERSRYVLLED